MVGSSPLATLHATELRESKTEMTNSAPSEGSGTQKDQIHSEGTWGAIRKRFENNWSQVLLFVGGLALYILLGLFLWWLLQRYVDPSAIKNPSKEATAKKDLLQALGLIMAGVAGAIGIYFTWRGQRITQDNLQQNQENTLAQLENAQRGLDITREGQITENFTRAIDQLGKTEEDGKTKCLEIRLGGIYALERFARETEKDHWPIMEVLTAYARHHRRWPKEELEATEAATVEKYRQAPPFNFVNFNPDPLPVEGPPLDPDIQAIITVLRRRTRSFGDGEPERLDLHATNLLGANLSGANLSESNLSVADLEGATLFGANLSRSKLVGANLHQVNFFGGKGPFWEAKLVAADLEGANLSIADLSGADLGGANLKRAVLMGANLMGTNLEGANHLTQAQLAEALGNQDTRLPPDLEPPARWNGRSDEQSEGEIKIT